MSLNRIKDEIMKENARKVIEKFLDINSSDLLSRQKKWIGVIKMVFFFTGLFTCAAFFFWKMFWCSNIFSTRNRLALSILIFNFAEVSNHPQNPFPSQYLSNCVLSISASSRSHLLPNRTTGRGRPFGSETLASISSFH